jgi:hypothetical protein
MRKMKYFHILFLVIEPISSLMDAIHFSYTGGVMASSKEDSLSSYIKIHT